MTRRPDTCPAWARLKQKADQAHTLDIAALFDVEPARMDNMCLSLGDILVDLSKNKIDQDTLNTLITLGHDMGLQARFADMLAGAHVNVSEDRPALHTNLRLPAPPQQVADLHARMRSLSAAIRADTTITDIVHIGIGGSHLGPQLVCEALAPSYTGPRIHFVANVDPDELDQTLAKLNPAHTCVLVASKSFTTAETSLNFAKARTWLGPHAPARIIALTANLGAAKQAGIKDEHILPLWDWVGGRFSVWSSIGLPIALACSFKVFEQFLAGAYEVDQHAASAPLARNIPALMALLELWYRNFMGVGAFACVPYASTLAHLPAYLQQLFMESNGKSVDVNGKPITYATAAPLMGQVGTNAQHAFFQMLHQGTTLVPCDFVASCTPRSADKTAHKVLLANMFAQSRALMVGQKAGAHQSCAGAKPSTCIILPTLDAHSLGALLALYEHKTAFLGFLWNINSFDQFGVSLGKNIAKELLAPQDGIEQNNLSDPSTNKLILHTFLGQ